MADFVHPELEDAVAPGRVGARDARVWVRSARPGTHRLVVREAGGKREHAVEFEVPEDPALDRTAAVDVPEGVLAPRHLYALRVEQGEHLVGEGCFRTAPSGVDDAADPFAFAVASCHLPFGSDGRVHEEALRMLRVAERVLEERAVERVLFVGDQMYSDMPEGLSLFEDEHFRRVGPRGRDSILACTPEEVRALYQRRYRLFWNVEPHLRIQARWPCLPILDDHDIIDNFGSAEVHAEPGWQSLKEGALAAYLDYQGLRVFGRPASRPRSFHYAFEHGPVACFVMDLRSERRAAQGRCVPYGDGQLADLRRYLEAQAHRPILVLVLSVPFLHVPDWLMDVGETLYGGEDTDPADRWSHPRMHAARDRLLGLLHAHHGANPAQKILIVGGDVHVGLAAEIRWCDSDDRLVQLVSSPLSNEQGVLVEQMARLAPSMSSTVLRDGEPFAEARLLEGEVNGASNPFGNLNLGIVTFRRQGDAWSMRLELVAADDGDPPSPRLVYRSHEL